MSLIGARLLQCDCFHNQAPYYGSRGFVNATTGIVSAWRQKDAKTLPPALRKASTQQLEVLVANQGIRAAFDNAAPQVAKPRAFEGVHTLAKGTPWMCRSPIAMHPVRDGAEQLAWSTILHALQ